jgi:hypothetical protein
MIPAHNPVDAFPNPADHRVGIGAIADYIATADDLFVAGIGVHQYGAQRLPIGVNIAED